MVAAAIRTIFAQPKADMVSDQLSVIAGMLGRQSPKVETMLRDAAEDLLAFTAFPPGHSLGVPFAADDTLASVRPGSSQSAPRAAIAVHCASGHLARHICAPCA
jgi:hypothetical protein